MSERTSISWTDATWNPIRGCSRVSEGCRHCYAELIAARFSGPGQPYEGLARRRSNGEPQWTGVVRPIKKHLADPIRWRRPRRIFVNSMSDLFHESLDVGYIAQVFAVMYLTPRHTFQVLTKRPLRMLEILTSATFYSAVLRAATYLRHDFPRHIDGGISDRTKFPHPNVWLGVSVEDQQAADERIPLLLKTPAAVRFLSCEPLLGPVDILEAIRVLHRIDWVIVGGESGPGARPCRLSWIEQLMTQCREHDVAVFVKQLGSRPWEDRDWVGIANDLELRDRKGGDPSEWPEDLRVREMPTSAVHA
jgi:protein gp37